MNDVLPCPACSDLVSRDGRVDELEDWKQGEQVTCPCCNTLLVVLVVREETWLEEA